LSVIQKYYNKPKVFAPQHNNQVYIIINNVSISYISTIIILFNQLNLIVFTINRLKLADDLKTC